MTQQGPRDLMPNVAKRIDQYRTEWGREWVNECIKRGMRGEPGWFYAFEAGQVVGTPFTNDQATLELVQQAACLGSRFVVVMRPKAKVGDGAH